jgi:hypothetical protein
MEKKTETTKEIGDMAICCTPGCPNAATKRCRNCVNCRAHNHRWDKRKPDDIVGYVHRLNLYRSRMNTIVHVRDDDVTRVPHEELEKKQLGFYLQRTKRKAKAYATEFKRRNSRRKRK